MSVSAKLDEIGRNVVVLSASSRRSYRAYLFGPFCIMHDNQPLGESSWRRNKARTLLKWFLLNPGKFFSADQLSKVCWPGIEKGVAAKNLHVAIHYLRHLLEPDLTPGQGSTFIRRNKDNFYWFDFDENWWVDLFEIQRLSASAREADCRSDLTTTIACYRQLIDYYTLGFLPEEVYEDIFTPYRRKYDYEYEQALEKLIQICARSHMYDEALTYALQALSLDPYCEAAVKAIASVYFQQGNAAGALHTLDTFQTFLREELGAAMNEEMLGLRANILQLR